MIARVTPSPLSGDVAAVKSKSYAHRLLIAAALSGGEMSFGDSRDAYLTAHALESLGFDAKFSDESVRYGAFHKKEKSIKVEVGESGSTLRFLVPLSAALGVQAEFAMEGRLAERPMTALAAALSAHGALWEDRSVKGQLCPGVYEIDATVSSQFVSGLLMALPLLDGDSELRLLGRAVSAPYINITLEVLSSAGIEIKRTAQGFFVRGRQKYNLKSAVVPGDFSGAAFCLVAGALGEGVRMTGLDPKNAQGDKAILDFLRRAGARVAVSDREIIVRKGGLLSFRADIGETPDLAPILSVVAAYAQGESVLERVSRLKDKESDRLRAIRDMLMRAGIATREEGNALVIAGGAPHGADFNSYSDHRMAMAEAILAAYATGESRINDMMCVRKSYPRFWEDFARLGGRYEVEGR